ncbi:MAG: GntR family transcriptional regulator [Phenylobacterium sp. SCN 70-31]|nr:MAG: GntR family transcriptional regulator [Phenylobacterium sp. SCN 70-31]
MYVSQVESATVNRVDPSLRWLDRVGDGAAPIYLRVAGALEAAVRDGELQPGDQLPPQRAVARALGVDLTTVTRAYAAARARGLLEGAVGRGTFVRSVADEAGRVDLSMNLPPPPQGVPLGRLLKETTAAILDRTDPSVLMAYHPGGGSLGQRVAGAAWLAPVLGRELGDLAPERVLVAPGAQTALAAVLALAPAGSALVVEPLVYPGVITAARRLGLRLVVCPADAGGMDPEALARVLAAERPAAVYVTPTTNNPTAVTMDAGRRAAIAQAARVARVWIVEDDPYARLLERPLPSLASLAPERTFHIATLSKCLSPGLRTAYLVPPPGPTVATTAEALRALAQMPAPLMTAVVTAWIREGTAEALLAGVRREALARRALAAEMLPTARGAAESLHVWLDLPAGRDPARLRRLAQERGLALVAADAFAAAPDHPDGLRISLGGPAKQVVLRTALEGVAALLSDSGPARAVV